MNRFILILVALWMVVPVSCSSLDLAKVEEHLEKISGEAKINENEAAKGLKAALLKGAEVGSSQLSKKDGFFKNPVIKIPFPPEFKSIEQKLRQLGFDQLVNRAILSFNRAAEEATNKAYPIFSNAISEMSFEDAMRILLGSEDEATVYLKQKTTGSLQQAFLPVVEKSAKETLATRYWNDLAKIINRNPLSQKKLPEDISEYITKRAISGLFYRIAKEEKQIRNQPIERTSDLLRKVFGYADAAKSSSQSR